LTAFCAAALPRAQIWRTALGIVMAFAMVVAMSLLLRIGADTILFGRPQSGARELLMSALRETQSPSSTLSLLIYLATFVGFWPALWVTLRVVHGRSGATLWGPEGRINWRHFRIGLAISLGPWGGGVAALRLCSRQRGIRAARPGRLAADPDGRAAAGVRADGVRGTDVPRLLAAAICGAQLVNPWVVSASVFDVRGAASVGERAFGPQLVRVRVRADHGGGHVAHRQSGRGGRLAFRA
jgi:hypothetical protein